MIYCRFQLLEAMKTLNVYILPTGSIDARASNVNGMSVSYVSGKKQLVNRNKEVYPLSVKWMLQKRC